MPSLNIKRPVKKEYDTGGNVTEWRHFSVRPGGKRMDRIELIKGPIKRMFGVELRVSERGIGLEGPDCGLQRAIDCVDDAVDGSFDYARGMLGLTKKVRRSQGNSVLYVSIDENHIARLIGRNGSVIRHIARQTNTHLWYSNDTKRLEITSTRIRNCENAEAIVQKHVEMIQHGIDRGERRKSRSPTITGSSSSSSMC